MIHLPTILRIIGSLLHLLGIIFLICAGISLGYGENDLFAFLASSFIASMVGLWLRIISKGHHTEFSRRDSYLTIALCWLVFALFGTFPYLLSGYIPHFTDAFFESMSGFTTTGSTILNNIESFPHALLFWRSLTQWLGGLGIVFFTVAVLPAIGVDKVQLFAAESTGLSHQKAHSRVSISARWIFVVYLTLTIGCMLSLYACGMTPYEAINHSFTAISTGGFSTRQSSIEAFASPAIEYTLSLFMFLAGINYTLLYLLLLKGRFKQFYRDSEFRYYLLTVLGFTAVITYGLCVHRDLPLESSFRQALFQVISLQTTTGYNSVDFMLWPAHLWFILSFTMYLGACGGSSTGAMKCGRVAILVKSIRNEFNRILHPNAVIPVRMDHAVISQSTRTTVLTFTCLYFLVIIVGWIALMFMGVGFLESYSMTISSLGNVGPGLGTFGPTSSWSALPAAAKWLCSFLMLTGRLELFTILLMFTPSFWRKNK